MINVPRLDEARLDNYMHLVRLLVSARLIQPANSVFLSQKTSTSQPKLAPTPTSEQGNDQVLFGMQ